MMYCFVVVCMLSVLRASEMLTADGSAEIKSVEYPMVFKGESEGIIGISYGAICEFIIAGPNEIKDFVFAVKYPLHSSDGQKGFPAFRAESIWFELDDDDMALQITDGPGVVSHFDDIRLEIFPDDMMRFQVSMRGLDTLQLLIGDLYELQSSDVIVTRDGLGTDKTLIKPCLFFRLQGPVLHKKNSIVFKNMQRFNFLKATIPEALGAKRINDIKGAKGYIQLVCSDSQAKCIPDSIDVELTFTHKLVKGIIIIHIENARFQERKNLETLDVVHLDVDKNKSTRFEAYLQLSQKRRVPLQMAFSVNRRFPDQIGLILGASELPESAVVVQFDSYAV